MKRKLELEDAVAKIIAADVVSGLAMCAVGIALYYSEGRHGLEVSFSEEWILHMGRLFGGYGLFDSYVVLSLGVLTLILAPYFRAAASLVYFLLAREYRYASVTLTVLAIFTVLFLLVLPK